VLDKEQVRKIARSYADKVRRFYNPRQVIIFGSYIDGSAHEDSDIDIAVVFDGIEGNFLEMWGSLVGLREGISYDIEAHLLDQTMDNCGFLRHIQKTGEVLYQA